jgi:hypothetical protein
MQENQEDWLVFHGTALKTIVEGLTAGQTYQFKVSSSTAAGVGAWSTNSYSFLIADEPTAPLGLEVTASDDTHVALRWRQPQSSGGLAITAFKVYREDASLAAPTPQLLGTLAASSFVYDDTTVTAGTPYKYYIRAQNTLGGEGVASTYVLVTPINVPAAPAAPTEVAKGKEAITIAWAAPATDGGATVTRYLLYVRAEHASAYQQIYAGIATSF